MSTQRQRRQKRWLTAGHSPRQRRKETWPPHTHCSLLIQNQRRRKRWRLHTSNRDQKLEYRGHRDKQAGKQGRLKMSHGAHVCKELMPMEDSVFTLLHKHCQRRLQVESTPQRQTWHLAKGVMDRSCVHDYYSLIKNFFAFCLSLIFFPPLATQSRIRCLVQRSPRR